MGRALSITIRRAKFSFLCFASSFLAYSQTSPAEHPQLHLGPILDTSPLALGAGTRTEALGPLFGFERSGAASLFRFTPLFSLYRDSSVEQTEAEVVYPILAFDRFGKEY